MFSMRWPVIWVIFRREVRDQLRDRRTLFMIFVLPILLYPMLGIGMAQLATALEQKPRTIAVVGAEFLPAAPPLLNAARDRFDFHVLEFPDEAGSLHVLAVPASSPLAQPGPRKEALRSGTIDVVVLIPADIQKRIHNEAAPFRPELIFDSGEERSRNTARTIRDIFANWNDLIIHQRLERDAKPKSYLQAVAPKLVDVAQWKGSGDNVWARLFPFLLVMMSLTGAFYPAIDLCAGEKERGTMETLLISPASRPEIVMGKFLTVMLASIAMALLNLASMALTAFQITARFGMHLHDDAPITSPGLGAMLWMGLFLVPLAAFFSALCVALATMARSVKEGQYYLTPLYIIILPLIFATLAPGIELNLFTSLVPVTGVSLLLRSLMQGKFIEARHYFLPVLLPLLVYGALALRWAVDQFCKETVLFREAERFSPRAWLVHLVRDRDARPTHGAALFCFALMLATAWYSFRWMNQSWVGMIEGQILFVALPPLLLTFLLTSSPRTTLRLRKSPVSYLALAVGLALCLNPLANELGRLVNELFPAPQAVKEQVNHLLGSLPNLGVALLALAVVPPICEEIAFRGFILSGLETEYRREVSIVLSAFLFGFLHVLLSLFQQLFPATLLGIVLALLAIRSGSLLPGILFHMLHNGLALLPTALAGSRVSVWLYRDPAQGYYHGIWIVLGALASAALLVPLFRPRAGHIPDPVPGDRAAARVDALRV